MRSLRRAKTKALLDPHRIDGAVAVGAAYRKFMGAFFDAIGHLLWEIFGEFVVAGLGRIVIRLGQCLRIVEQGEPSDISALVVGFVTMLAITAVVLYFTLR